MPCLASIRYHPCNCACISFFKESCRANGRSAYSIAICGEDSCLRDRFGVGIELGLFRLEQNWSFLCCHHQIGPVVVYDRGTGRVDESFRTIVIFCAGEDVPRAFHIHRLEQFVVFRERVWRYRMEYNIRLDLLERCIDIGLRNNAALQVLNSSHTIL